MLLKAQPLHVALIRQIEGLANLKIRRTGITKEYSQRLNIMKVEQRIVCTVEHLSRSKYSLCWSYYNGLVDQASC